MKKRFFFYTIGLFLFLGFFSPVFADIGQTDIFYTSPAQNSNWYNYIGTGITGTSSQFRIYDTFDNPYVNYRKLSIFHCSVFFQPAKDTSRSGACINAGGSYIQDEWNEITYNRSGNYWYWNYALNFDPDGHYYIFGYQDYRYLLGTDTGDLFIGSDGSPNNYDNFGDMKSVAWEVIGVDRANPIKISMEYPPDLASLPTDFTTWISKFTTTAGGSYAVKIDYFDYSSPSVIYSDTAGLSMPTAVSDFDFQVAKSTLLIGGHNHNAIMYLLDSDNNILASDTADFTAGYNLYDNSTYIILPPTSTSTELNISCDPDSGFFQYSLCYLATSLFIPSQNSLDNYYGLWDMIKHKAPIGYISSAIDSYSEIQSATSSAFTLATPPELETSILNPFKTGLSWVLWFSFGIFIIKRIGKENL